MLWGLPIGATALIILIAIAQSLRELPGVQAFIKQYPGIAQAAPSVDSGFPWWMQHQHFVNMFFMLFIIRAGVQILADHPRLYWKRDSTRRTDWFRFQVPVPTGRVWTSKDDSVTIPAWLGLPSIIAANVKRPPFEEGPVNPRDPGASFTVKNDKTYFGYKAHIAVDEESDLIRQAEMTSADLHDSQRGEAMIQGDEAAYYADKAYDSKSLREKLASQGIDDKIAYKAQRNKPLKNWQKWFNTTASSVRSGVERSNATMKNWYGMARVRYLGLARNNCHLQFVACAMNMKRGLVLLRAA